MRSRRAPARTRPVTPALRAIPDFRLDTDQPLMERGGGSMMTLLALPLAWDRKTASCRRVPPPMDAL